MGVEQPVGPRLVAERRVPAAPVSEAVAPAVVLVAGEPVVVGPGVPAPSAAESERVPEVRALAVPVPAVWPLEDSERELAQSDRKRARWVSERAAQLDSVLVDSVPVPVLVPVAMGSAAWLGLARVTEEPAACRPTQRAALARPWEPVAR